MAKNYTIKEAVEIIAKGTDLEAIAELGKRFPVLSVKIATVAAKAGEDFVDFMGYMPEHLTANKVNTVIKNGLSTDVESDEENDTEEDAEGTTTPAPKKAKTKANSEPAEGVTWNEDMSGKELVKALRKAGKGGLITSKKKADLIELCKKVFGAPEAAEADVDEDVEVEETEANPYEGMTAMELFKECKKRGIKAEAKKKAKYYIDLLTKDDAKAAEPVEEDDDWGDEEEVEETPAPAKETKKSSKKAEKKAEKKAAKKVEEAEDDDDDWDI